MKQELTKEAKEIFIGVEYAEIEKLIPLDDNDSIERWERWVILLHDDSNRSSSFPFGSRHFTKEQAQEWMDKNTVHVESLVEVMESFAYAIVNNLLEFDADLGFQERFIEAVKRIES